MNFQKPKFLSTVSLIGVLLLTFGLGLTVVSTQQQQDNRSQAAYSRPSTPSSIQTEQSSQTSLGPCWEPAGGGERAGAMCKSDGGTQYSSVTEANALARCPGGFVGTNARNGATASNTWYCPGGNEYRCCKNARPTITSASASKSTINVGETVTLSGNATDPDTENWRNYITYKWSKAGGTGPTNPSFPPEDTSANASITGLQAGTYVFRLTATDGFASDTKDVTVTVNGSTNSGDTTFAFNIFLHGIGKTGDSQTSDTSGSNQDPDHRTRSLVVEVREQSNSPIIVSKTADVTFEDASGSYKGNINMGPGLSKPSYAIKVKFTQSLWKEVSQQINSGQTNNIQTITLKNGDTNNDGNLNGTDTQLIKKCLVDEDDEFNAPGQGASCTADEKLKADINDDGIVSKFDLSLLFREMSNQQ